MALSLTINGELVDAEAGESLLDVARRNRVQIPSLCHHPHIKPDGACRICLVEVTRNGRKKLTTACNYEVLDGIEVETRTQEIAEHREMLLELLLGQAPNARRLKTLAEAYGPKENSFSKVEPPSGRDDCILCGLCSRVCEEVVGACAITLARKGEKKGIDVPFKEFISDACIGCGACDAICPTNCIDMESKKVEELRKLPVTNRPCRYALMGMMDGAICANNYECASCEVDQRVFEVCYPEHPVFAARGRTSLPGYND
jgi:bidirectional [NiFe] hydrogenase diaphorase subunit